MDTGENLAKAKPTAAMVRAWSAWCGAVAAAAAILAAAGYLAPLLAMPPTVAYLIGFLILTAEVLAVSWLTPRTPARSLWLVGLAIIVLWVARGAGGAGIGLAMLVTAALLTAASLGGAAVGYRIEQPGHLLFVAIVSAVADILSLCGPHGFTAAVARSPQALSILALPWPMLGTGRIEPFLGVGDVLFAGLYLAASRRHALSSRRTVSGLAAAFVVVAALVVASRQPVPVLPALGAAMVLAHPEARRLPPWDLRVGLAALLLLALLLAALFWL